MWSICLVSLLLWDVSDYFFAPLSPLSLSSLSLSLSHSLTLFLYLHLSQALSLFLFLSNFLSFYLSRNLSLTQILFLKWLTFSPSITVYLFVSLSLSLCHSFFHFCPSPQMFAFIYSSIDWVIWLFLQFLITVPLSLFSNHATLSHTLTLSNALTHSGSCVRTPNVSVSNTRIISLSLSVSPLLSLSLSTSRFRRRALSSCSASKCVSVAADVEPIGRRQTRLVFDQDEKNRRQQFFSVLNQNYETNELLNDRTQNSSNSV